MQSLQRVADAKSATLDEHAVNRSVHDFCETRDVLAAASDFAFWHTDGNGQNRPVRKVAQGYRNWLRTSPEKGKANRQPNGRVTMADREATIGKYSDDEREAARVSSVAFLVAWLLRPDMQNQLAVSELEERLIEAGVDKELLSVEENEDRDFDYVYRDELMALIKAEPLALAEFESVAVDGPF
jgi:hypothetical protein